MANNQDGDIHIWGPEWHPDEDLTDRQYWEIKKEMDAWLNESNKKIPTLKALAAMAACEKFKNSDEIRKFTEEWKELKSGGVEPLGLGWMEVYWSYCDREWGPESKFQRCGYCRFVRWIRSKEIPGQLKGYCRSFLRNLANNHPEFEDGCQESSDIDEEEEVDEEEEEEEVEEEEEEESGGEEEDEDESGDDEIAGDDEDSGE